ncbi:unnamed protein product [Ceutorhynchus assimilis]|uniref:Nidogen-1 n=1 Tax=Ceutorhynchus assimilis TaxID=467358 RepID=A0A9P0DKR9_9CUCU|nr:unnamed protein product [Ceutorhynchus assimilis]
MRFKFSIFLLCCLCADVRSIPKELLYQFDVSTAKLLPAEDDVSTDEIQLQVPIAFYGSTYKSIYVNSNGFLSFQTEIPHFINIEFPLDYPIIAPFYSNVDTREVGTISYHETQDPSMLERATENVHENFIDSAEFQATSLFIVTWHDVGYFDRKADKVNTFQVVLITDGQESYAELLYPENGIQWIQGTGDQSGLPDARAQVGFLSTDGKMHTLPGSATEQIRQLDKWSNMNLVGQFIFKISENSIIQPDSARRAPNPAYPLTCAEVPTACHSQADCIDYQEGFCCRCKNTFIGNGKYCIKEGVPLRANGKVNGKLNGERLENLDLQSYIVTADGRAYTAISKVPESIGADIQTLQVLGSVIGYLFAKPVRGAINGFEKTGGLLNHTSTITFLNSSQVVHVNQKFLGLDVYDYLKVEIDIQGEIPTLPPNAQIIIDEYQEQYTQTSKGLIQMSADRAYIYTSQDAQEITNVFRIEQTLEFGSCAYINDTVGESWTLKVGRNFISYESREQIIRFGLSNKITPIGDYDPCIEGRQSCGPNSACVVDGNSFQCVCNPGYQRIFSGNDPTCVDENECQSNHECDPNAQCFNTIGSYQCSCNPGFDGDGKRCIPANSCINITCTENAECVQNGAQAACRCLAGFRGDGYICQAIQSQGCDVSNNCSPYGICSIDPRTGQFGCSCHPGFVGDGYYCVQDESTTVTEPIETATVLNNEWVEPKCQEDGTCLCPEGYEFGTGTRYCRQKTAPTPAQPDDCRTLNNCDYNARCLFNEILQGYLCLCNEGFDGDGFTCHQEPPSCAEVDNCDRHATCTYIESDGKSKCLCNPEFEGDGYSCAPIASCNSDSDCTHTEDCLYQNGRYECVCKDRHVRDSQHICVPIGGTCGGGTCVENAECVFDEDYQTNYCTCKPGFIGDGITECRDKPVGCDTLNNCALHATCQYSEEEFTYVCRCNPGFYGDGHACEVEINCLVDRSMCDSNAQCVTDSSRKYMCQCNQGFVGNGSVCKEIARSEGNFLLLNQGWATHKIPMEANKRNPGRPIQIKTYQTAVGLDIDCLEGRVYWSDISLHAIRTSLYNGSDNSDFMTLNVNAPEGLAVDWVSRNIYWTDSISDTVEVANLDSKRRRTLISNNLVNPRGIAVHPQRGKIFWSDWDRTHPKIEWANADGTDRRVFLEGPAVSLPNSLAIDYDTEELCYSDAGTKKIECVQIDTRRVQTIAVNCTYPFGIAITDKMVYWSDWISKKIERVDKHSLNRLPPLNVPAGGSGNKLFGLAAVPNSCPALANICQYTRCPEEHICLPDGKGSKSCLCARKSDVNEEPSCVM